MIFLTEEKLKDEVLVEECIQKKKKLVKCVIKIEERKKNIILNYMQRFANSSDDVDINRVDTTFKLLKELSNSLNLLNKNIDLLSNVFDELDKMLLVLKEEKTNIANSSYVIINDFNTKYENIEEKIVKNDNKIEKCLYDVSVKSEQNTTNNIEKKDIPSLTKNTFKENIETTSNNALNKDSKYTENTLIISDINGKIVLPYTIKEVNEILKNNTERYKDFDDVINKNYTLSTKLYKNPFISRFREAFKLMRNKEKRNIKESFDLGMELIFNYNLHPAIITACRNLDELDIYLDYLENGETQKFDCFKIIFNTAPTIIK